MRIKRYLVRDMQEAMEIIKHDLGSDAVIISSRQVRDKGLKGLFGNKKLEVMAAVDQQVVVREQAAQDPGHDQLKQEIAEMRALLQRISLNKPGVLVPAQVSGNDKEQWRKALSELDLNPNAVDYLMAALNDGGSREPLSSEAMQTYLREQMSGAFIPPPRDAGRVLAFVGPTGVGKTTTIAKLAAKFTLFENKSLALVTIDTYRIGALEQLRTYGEILNVPVEVVMTPKELRAVIASHSDKDLILIDTAGRPSSSAVQISELRAFLDGVKDLETYLVLSCATKDRDLERILREFRPIGLSRLVFTKIDETDTLGSIFNIALLSGLPVAFIANGQRVPDDLETAEPNKLAALILGVPN